ncbi:LamB/YcsF family protein [Agromyces protaetiae]|uniref:LamB/YcsF family protein n=1 Tax=Agromyces protaetiae TaxID=2509455 RepID=UPI001FB5DE7A|nr:5-oxoprolinase subunit PxpA [Agromyces protaetiae]
MAAIDLNSDLGEWSVRQTVGDDAAIFAVVASANVACGFHAGDAASMRASVAQAVSHGVVLGAHPGYRDPEGFGRRDLDVPADVIAAELLEQLGALDALAHGAGIRVRYVKAHGALYHRLGRDERAANLFAEAVAGYGAVASSAASGALDASPLALLGLAGSALERAAAAAGLRFAREGFADRGARPDGSLIPRGEPGAVLHDPGAVAARAVELAHAGGVDSICLHGDTPGAADLARAVRAALEADGVEIRSFV